MSPRVLNQGGYRISILTNDHPPAHVHVKNGEKAARIGLAPVHVLTNVGFNNRELGKILEIVTEHQAELLAEWDKIHPKR